MFVYSNSCRIKSHSTTLTQEQLYGKIAAIANDLGLQTECQQSNHEGEIVDILLNADPKPSVVILQWNGECYLTQKWEKRQFTRLTLVHLFIGSLSQSPSVLQALHLVDYPVVLLNPMQANHETLPSSVKGIISGEYR